VLSCVLVPGPDASNMMLPGGGVLSCVATAAVLVAAAAVKWAIRWVCTARALRAASELNSGLLLAALAATCHCRGQPCSCLPAASPPTSPHATRPPACPQLVPDVPYFASKVLLGPEGVAKVMPIGDMSAFEKEGYEKMLPELKAQISKGIAFAAEGPAPVAA
jgi:hypothetical protein